MDALRVYLNLIRIMKSTNIFVNYFLELLHKENELDLIKNKLLQVHLLNR